MNNSSNHDTNDISMINIGVKTIIPVILKNHNYYRKIGPIWSDPKIHLTKKRRELTERPELDILGQQRAILKEQKQKIIKEKERIENIIIRKDLTQQATYDRRLERLELEVMSGTKDINDVAEYWKLVQERKFDLANSLSIDFKSPTTQKAVSRPASALPERVTEFLSTTQPLNNNIAASDRSIDELYLDLLDDDDEDLETQLMIKETNNQNISSINPNMLRNLSLEVSWAQGSVKNRDYFSKGPNVLSNPNLVADNRIQFIDSRAKDEVAIKMIDERFKKEEVEEEKLKIEKRNILANIKRSFNEQVDTNKHTFAQFTNFKPRAVSATTRISEAPHFHTRSVIKNAEPPYVSKKHLDYSGLLDSQNLNKNKSLTSRTTHRDLLNTSQRCTSSRGFKPPSLDENFSEREESLNEIKDFERRFKKIYS